MFYDQSVGALVVMSVSESGMVLAANDVHCSRRRKRQLTMRLQGQLLEIDVAVEGVHLGAFTRPEIDDT